MPRFAKTQAIVLRKYDYSESSHVLSVFSADFGRIQLLAKGSRRVKRKRMPGFLDHLTRARIVYIPKPGDALCTLTEFEILDDYKIIRRDLLRLANAFLTVEILDRAGQADEADPGLYALAAHILGELDQCARPSIDALMIAFEMRFLERLGFGLVLDRCVVTGKPRSQCRGTRFSAALGGLVDGEARGADPYARRVSPGLTAVLEALARGSWNAARRTRLAPAIVREARRLCVHNYQHLFERRIKSARFFEHIAPASSSEPSRREPRSSASADPEPDAPSPPAHLGAPPGSTVTATPGGAIR